MEIGDDTCVGGNGFVVAPDAAVSMAKSDSALA